MPKETDLLNRDNIPEQLQSQLKQPRPDERGDNIAAIVWDLDREVSIDDVLIAYWNRYGNALTRTFVSGKLNQLTKAGRLTKVPGRKGIYSPNFQAEAEGGADDEGEEAEDE